MDAVIRNMAVDAGLGKIFDAHPEKLILFANAIAAKERTSWALVCTMIANNGYLKSAHAPSWEMFNALANSMLKENVPDLVAS